MLSAVETGPKDAPSILFIHGLSQTYDAWSRQFASDLAETFHLAATSVELYGGVGHALF